MGQGGAGCPGGLRGPGVQGVISSKAKRIMAQGVGMVPKVELMFQIISIKILK